MMLMSVGLYALRNDTAIWRRLRRELVLDSMEENKERLLRSSARIERMRREKQLQMKRRRMVRKYLGLGGGALSILAILITAAILLQRKPEVSQAQLPIEPELQTDMMLSPEVDEKGQAEGAGESIDRQSELPTAKASIAKTKEEAAAYSFTSTEETATIYNEEVISSYAILIDENTNTVVASKGARERISPASMTKVLTVLVAAEHITKEELDDTFIMTREIIDYGFINDCSVVGFEVGERITVRDLFYGTILSSGSDAALGLATYVAGSHEAFVELMNAKLEELGLSDSAHFTNCVGLYDEEHYCTTYDMAVIMKAAIKNDLCKEVLSAHTYTTVPTAEHPEGMLISNWFLRRIEDKDTGGEVICAKTGHVVQSGSCAVSYGKFGDEGSYICVTADSTGSWACIYDQVKIYNQYVTA